MTSAVAGLVRYSRQPHKCLAVLVHFFARRWKRNFLSDVLFIGAFPEQRLGSSDRFEEPIEANGAD